MTKFMISYTREFSEVIKKYKKVFTATNRQEAEWAFNRFDKNCTGEITDIKEITHERGFTEKQK